MLPKSQRISRELFPTLLSSRLFLNSPHLSLRLAPSSQVKVAVSVSKKVSKSAVIRNRTRRRTSNALRELILELKPHLLLFIAKPGAEKLTFIELKREIEEMIGSIKN